jgi:hypothetical protein
MVRKGLGFINQALDLVPRFVQNKHTSRLIAPRVAPEQLNDDALGRALETLYGVTELYSLLAATATQRLGLAPRFAHLDRTSFHVDGRYNTDEEPEAHVIHITRGYQSRSPTGPHPRDVGLDCRTPSRTSRADEPPQ